jgi:lactate dehydrogenase-like 2-hydroxyacid dehydrogenase
MLDFDRQRPNAWKQKGTLLPKVKDVNLKSPNTCTQEIVGMIGYGIIGKFHSQLNSSTWAQLLTSQTKGKRIASLCRALGMKILISDRKHPQPSPNGVSARHSNEPRTPFAEVLRSATVLMLALPLTADTHNLISTTELAAMRPDAIIVNVSRGRIVDEQALVAALTRRDVFGYGTDVFETEPAGSAEDSVLLGEEARGLNVVLTPHLAWSSDTTRANVMRLVEENVRHWVEGSEVNTVV